jgi:hypothetical protein
MSAQPRPRPPLRKVAVRLGLGALALLLVIQLVPYGRDHANPPVTQEARLDVATQAIVTESCADCHSNLTRWPWYTSVAPASWIAQSDVDGGRRILNFSRWDTPQPAVERLVQAVSSGAMPPLKYRILPNHAKARLSGAAVTATAAAESSAAAFRPPPASRRGSTPRPGRS